MNRKKTTEEITKAITTGNENSGNAFLEGVEDYDEITGDC